VFEFASITKLAAIGLVEIIAYFSAFIAGSAVTVGCVAVAISVEGTVVIVIIVPSVVLSILIGRIVATVPHIVVIVEVGAVDVISSSAHGV
jgi:hypothetical protein